MLEKLVIFISLGAAGGCAPDHDIVIRGGTPFDGTGSPGVVGDIAIDDDRITAIGQIDGSGELEIDTAGLYVAPGFTDMQPIRRPSVC